jgi:hypothetical protein
MQTARVSSRHTRIVTIVTFVLTVAFVTFFNLSKHLPAFSAVNPFAEDPADAVGSIGIQLAGLSILIALLRMVRPYPQGFSEAHALRILRADLVALLAILVTMFADAVAMIRYASIWMEDANGWLLLGSVLALATAACLAGWQTITWQRTIATFFVNPDWVWPTACITIGIAALSFYPDAWRQTVPGALLTAFTGFVFLMVLTAAIARWLLPISGSMTEDIWDDGNALLQAIAARAAVFGQLLLRIQQKIERATWLRAWSPRRHPWRLLVLVALGMGFFILSLEMLSEGTPNFNMLVTVSAVFIGLEGSAVALGYLLFHRYLEIQ